MTAFHEARPQVGGNHYAKGGDFQHWDLIEVSGIGYLEGCATKYVARWRDKNGVEDLKKAAHYVEKLCVQSDLGRKPRGEADPEHLARFFERHPLEKFEREVITKLCSKWNREDLLWCLACIRVMIDRNQNGQQQSPTT